MEIRALYRTVRFSPRDRTHSRARKKVAPRGAVSVTARGGPRENGAKDAMRSVACALHCRPRDFPNTTRMARPVAAG
jgi:hypothetical protein